MSMKDDWKKKAVTSLSQEKNPWTETFFQFLQRTNTSEILILDLTPGLHNDKFLFLVAMWYIACYFKNSKLIYRVDENLCTQLSARDHL